VRFKIVPVMALARSEATKTAAFARLSIDATSQLK
jgi:hypothetical protein